MALAAVSLDDKYQRERGAIYITGSQALVRLAMMQFARDRGAGLNTACFISGYRGSPMHNVDKELWRAQKFLGPNHIHFQPAVNEDLAATSIWGAQQAPLYSDVKYDGVFAMWYGKGPGLDRSVDAIRHANLAGTSPHGGVLAVVGDDHGMKSSDVPATCEPTFIDLMMPILYPASVQEILDYGLYGWALSRFCGAWVGFKTVADTLDTAVSVDVDPQRVDIVIPEDFPMPADGVHIRLPDPWVNQEPRLRRHKMDAAKAFARANRLNDVVIASPQPRFGIIASGKAATDVSQALTDLDIDSAKAADLGITLFKVAMPHPLDLEPIREFAKGLEEILVVEEKRRIVELGVKDALYVLPDSHRPRVVGRYDETGARLLTEVGELSPDEITRVLAKRIARFHESERIKARLAFLDAKARQAAERPALGINRLPYFCSGCPHNTSTRVPQGSRAHGGVGCHYMATYMERDNVTHTHMGGEGATWIGQAPFVDTAHVFQNLGDGTYHHCGLLAIRACVAAKVNITYKVLFNDAVAMTGGQPIDGPLNPSMISRQVHAEGVRKIAIVTDEPEKYVSVADLAPGTVVEHRGALDRVQREFREHSGVSVIIYDQTCAAEKRRRRKRGQMVDPAKRIFINDRVCEGCGDCNAKSNCLSVVPHDTEFGRKRRIDQSSCNKDYSCVNGFCPSFVSVIGGKPRKVAAGDRVPQHLKLLPEPDRPELTVGRPYSILVTGIGGTGVVTVGAMLTMAGHLEGKGSSSVDQFGMAQKGGAVTSHVRIAVRPEDIQTVRLNAGSADLVLGCDSLVAGADLALETVDPERTHLVINTHETITGHFTREPDLLFPAQLLRQRIIAASGADHVDFIDATRIATGLMGDSIATNLFMLGYAYQKGFIPVSAAGIETAIELNGVAVESNQETFRWGRRAAIDISAVIELVSPTKSTHKISATLDELVERRMQQLTAYQDADYVARYREIVDKVRSAERQKAAGMSGLAEAVARYAYKLMAYKDEYEVARLYTDGAFESQLKNEFEGDYRLEFHLAPPLFAPRDKETGLLTKRTYGPWMLRLMRLLARLKGLRGTPFDVFGYSAERKRERGLIDEYYEVVTELIADLNHDNHSLA
ncbi:MAG: indolepyruvate ferredoxin oxidoreductase family protein, partial [Gammaproteobacteria bacterium]|nr:indolepyruvate ferredoxin oxidoreductase family protein [Gammaproteobacteria bacterium]